MHRRECGVYNKVLLTSVFKNHLKPEHLLDSGKDLNILEYIATTSVEKRKELTEIFVLTQFTKS